MTQRWVMVTLRPISADAAAAVLAGRRPPDVRVADDYPTEFSQGIARQAGGGSPLRPFFIHRAIDDVAVGGRIPPGRRVRRRARGRDHPGHPLGAAPPSAACRRRP